MCLQIQDQECGELARAMICGLSSTKRFVELGFAIGAKVDDLRGRETGDVAAAAGVCWRCLEG